MTILSLLLYLSMEIFTFSIFIIDFLFFNLLSRRSLGCFCWQFFFGWNNRQIYYRILLKWSHIWWGILFIRFWSVNMVWSWWFLLIQLLLLLWYMTLGFDGVGHLRKNSIFGSVFHVIDFTLRFFNIAKGIFLDAKACHKKVHAANRHFFHPLLFIVYGHPDAIIYYFRIDINHAFTYQKLTASRQDR